MTKEELLKEFLSDELVVENGHLSKDEVERLRFRDPTENKLVEVIKVAIMSKSNGENDRIIIRKLNKLFN